jgi:hypothetical protein
MSMVEPPNQVFTDDALLAIIDNHRHPDGRPNTTALAAVLNVHRWTVQARLAKLARQGRLLGEGPAMPGFEITRVTSKQPDGSFVTQRPEEPEGELVLPKGHVLERASLKVGDSWYKTRVGYDPQDFLEAMQRAFENYTPAAPPTPLEDLPYQNFLTLYALPDMHIGMFSWGKETDVDWDLNIAEKAITETIEKIHLRTIPSEIGVVLVGGDAVHSDTRNNMTEKSGNILQVDGRYDKVVEVTERIVVRTVELALHKHRRVLVRVLKGNHDYHTSVAIAHFLKAWYRNDPRVSVDTSPSLFWFFQFGQNFIAAHHGHETKAELMPMKMADARPQIWGTTKYRYAHIFHWHRSEKKRDTIGGVWVEKHEAPIPKDDWGYGRSFLSGRSLCSIAYDPERGESSRVTENL